MTPFGEKIRLLRQERSMSQKQLAAQLHVSQAYLCALEHGHRAPPTFQFVQKVITAFNIIWDDAEELQKLAQLSHPRVIIDTSGMTVEATELANLLARYIGKLDKQTLNQLKQQLTAVLS
jgi:transcriptional regulator with XRE-family HTH domain